MKETLKKKDGLKAHALIFSVYVIAALALTYPLLFNMSSHVAGCCDAWQNLWNIWWVEMALAGDTENLYYTHHQFHPVGVSLAFHTLTILNSFTGAILQGFLGIVTAYNLIVLFSFPLAAYGAFLLVDHLTGDWRAAFISGLVFAFSPYHYLEVNIGHLNLLSIQWIPFYILYLMKTIQENKKRNPLLAAVFLAMTALTEWQYLGFLCIYTLVFLLFHRFSQPKQAWSKKVFQRLAVLGLLASILILPSFQPLLHEAFVEGREGYPMRIWLGSSYAYSSNLLSYILPNHNHPFYGNHAAALNGLPRARITLGYTPIILSIYALWKNRKFMKWIQEKRLRAQRLLRRKEAIQPVAFTVSACLIISYVIFGANVYITLLMAFLSLTAIVSYYLLKDGAMDYWLMITLLFLLLSAGPLMQLPDGGYCPLPYVLLYYLPLFKTFRAPYRFSVMAILAVSVLAGFGAKHLFAGKKARWKKWFVLISALVLFEYLSVPLLLSDANMPPIYDEIAANPKNIAVLEVPIPPRIFQDDKNITTVYGIPKLLYYQTHHQKPIIGGYISRITETPDYATKPLKENPLLYQLRNPPEDGVLDRNQTIARKKDLMELNVGYVIIHKDLFLAHVYPEDSFNYSVNLLTEVLGEKPTIKGNTAVFRVFQET